MKGQAESRLAAGALRMPRLPLLVRLPPGLVETGLIVCWRTAVVLIVKRLLYRGLYLHFTSSQANSPLQTCCASGLRRGREIPDLTPEPVLYFIITLGQFGASWLFLFPSHCCEFSFPSNPPVLPGRSLPEARPPLGGGFLVRNGSPLDISCTPLLSAHKSPCIQN